MGGRKAAAAAFAANGHGEELRWAGMVRLSSWHRAVTLAALPAVRLPPLAAARLNSIHSQPALRASCFCATPTDGYSVLFGGRLVDG